MGLTTTTPNSSIATVSQLMANALSALESSDLESQRKLRIFRNSCLATNHLINANLDVLNSIVAGQSSLREITNTLHAIEKCHNATSPPLLTKADTSEFDKIMKFFLPSHTAPQKAIKKILQGAVTQLPTKTLLNSRFPLFFKNPPSNPDQLTTLRLRKLIEDIDSLNIHTIKGRLKELVTDVVENNSPWNRAITQASTLAETYTATNPVNTSALAA